ncbi:hypothetical protein LSAT2_014404 [Lamellibrachia satsuma]|nr:hypothetical protein LSAT2_014404 [Lamellibrachia satsuma]
MKGSLLIAVFSLVALQAAADFGPFSAYGPCMCDVREYRSRVCEAEPCVGDYVESRPCDCVPLVPEDYPMLKGITCVTFDDDIKASQGLWLYNENVVVSDNACMSGTCGFFNSSAQSKLELAYFSNSLDIFETFSVSFFFKRSPGVSGQRSLLDNSECSDDGSLYAKSVSGGVSGSATNSAGDSVDFDSIVCTHFLQDSNSNCVFFKVIDDAWHQYAMTFNGSSVAFYVDGTLQEQKDLSGRLDRVKAPMVFGGCVCGGDCFFDGYMDTVSFVHGVLDDQSVAYLNSNPGECLPPSGP